MTRVARQEDIPAESIEVRLDRETKARVDAEGRQSGVRVARIWRHITVCGPLTREQEDRLFHAAEECHVANTLRSGLEIQDSIEVSRG